MVEPVGGWVVEPVGGLVSESSDHFGGEANSMPTFNPPPMDNALRHWCSATPAMCMPVVRCNMLIVRRNIIQLQVAYSLRIWVGTVCDGMVLARRNALRHGMVLESNALRHWHGGGYPQGAGMRRARRGPIYPQNPSNFMALTHTIIRL